MSVCSEPQQTTPSLLQRAVVARLVIYVTLANFLPLSQRCCRRLRRRRSRLIPSITLAVPCLSFIRCDSGLSLCHPPARRPFSARHARVASAATANVVSVFPFFIPLYPYVFRHLLVQRLHKREHPAPCHSAGCFARQLRRDGETAPAAAARRLTCSCLRCGLLFCV
jgi:hypothetical protein